MLFNGANWDTAAFKAYFEDCLRDLRPAPSWLIELLSQPQLGNSGVPTHTGAMICDGRRNSTLCSLAGTMRERGMAPAAIEAALLADNQERCEPPLDEEEVRKIARSVLRYPPNPYADVVVPGTLGNGAGYRDPATAAPSPTAAAGAMEFPLPVPASQLKAIDPDTVWLWRGYLSRGSLTLFSALWKSGKTTLIAHLLKAFRSNGGFCGQIVVPARVLYVTEESEGRWAGRRDVLGLQDNIHFLVRPFRARPDWATWLQFCQHLGVLIRQNSYDVLTIDALSNFWPVRDENDAPQVQSALMPLQTAVGEACAGLLVHHNRKSDGQEATAPRGSGAFMAFVDTILELRRYAPGNPRDRRRTLTGYGRHDETPDEVVVELSDTEGYKVHGTKAETGERDVVSILLNILPRTPPGRTIREIEDQWPGVHAPKHQRLTDALQHGAAMTNWQRDGEGTRGDPYRYWRPER